MLIGRARDFMLKAREQELAPYQITHRQAYVADILYNLGRKATLTELASYVDRGVNTLSYLMTRMERDGLVRRVREKPKSTLLKFELTERGEIAYKNSEKRESIKKIMSVLSEEEQQQLIILMQKLIKSAQESIL
jgi:DNA-binding MarR family transcriptional regulator